MKIIEGNVKRRMLYSRRCEACLGRLWADDKKEPIVAFACDCGCSSSVSVLRWLDRGHGTLLVTDGELV